MSRTAVIAGASGLVGGHLLDQLLADPTWDRVISVGRRELAVDHPKLTQLVVPFPGIGELPRCDDVFSCLGTTMKKAGSKSAFKAVDQDAVIALAGSAYRNGASQFLHVTALGASTTSRIFYNKVKGDTERYVRAVGIPTVVAFRPSMIDGDRPERRTAESVGLATMRVLRPILGKYAPNHAADIAAAMVAEAKRFEPGNRVVEAGQIPRDAAAG